MSQWMLHACPEKRTRWQNSFSAGLQAAAAASEGRGLNGAAPQAVSGDSGFGLASSVLAHSTSAPNNSRQVTLLSI